MHAIADDEIIETVETEILVCGAGTSGLFTTCAAAEEGAKVVRLEKGAIAKSSDGYIKINASKGTVVCTGGYARNEEMLKTLQPQTLNKYSLSIAIDGTTGDGIKACLWAGAHMDEVHTAMVFDRVAVKPDELGGSEPPVPCSGWAPTLG